MAKVRAYCLISGGLDSLLAVKLLQQQGVETIGVHFTSPFFDKSRLVEHTSRELGIPFEVLDFSQEQLDIIENPRFGFGKNINPCIDCHTQMLKKAGGLLNLSKKEFLATGEVLGQRPMSQNYYSLITVAKHSGFRELVVRPLSAQKLPPTTPEKEGWIHREKLLAVSGRGRRQQLELAKIWGLEAFHSPGGGCKLTEVLFADKLKKLKTQGQLTHTNLIKAMNYGRIFSPEPNKYFIVARNEAEGDKLLTIPADFTLLGTETAGPVILGFGDFTPEELLLGAKIFSFYSRVKGEGPAYFALNGQNSSLPAFSRLDFDQILEKMKF